MKAPEIRIPTNPIPDKVREINLEFIEKHLKSMMNGVMELMDDHDAIVPEIKVKYKDMEGFLSFKRLPKDHNDITEENPKTPE